MYCCVATCMLTQSPRLRMCRACTPVRKPAFVPCLFRAGAFLRVQGRRHCLQRGPSSFVQVSTSQCQQKTGSTRVRFTIMNGKRVFFRCSLRPYQGYCKVRRSALAAAPRNIRPCACVSRRKFISCASTLDHSTTHPRVHAFRAKSMSAMSVCCARRKT